ncbi:MAG TPA: hypothetical protein VFV37_04170 [Luteibaculaceae bacterium]|nr:hypothetical protein [Luteibaculaceae bacterium]
MMIRQFMFVFLGVVSVASSCEKPPGARQVYRIWIKNNSGVGVSYLVGQSYPDTAVPNEEESLLMLEPNGRRPYDQNEEWEDFFAKLPADTLSIFFFNNDTLAKYGFEQVRTDYNILKRKDVSLQDLKSDSFTVTYP